MLAPSLKTSDDPYPRRWLALGVLSMALLMIVAANTSLIVAVTDIQESLAATTSQSRWILDAYPLAVASLLLFFGAVGDRYGRRGALNMGLVAFAAASALGALSTTPGLLIASRALLGLAGALVMPATLAYVRVLFPPRERKTAFVIWSGSSGLALALGPLVAGAVVGPLGWEAVFWLNVPLSAVLLGCAALTIPASRNRSAPRIDVVGALLSIAILAPMTYGIIEGHDRGWLSAVVLGAFGVAVVALFAFVAWERRVASPMLDLTWFRAPEFRLGAGLTVLGFTAVVGMLYIAVLYLQQHELHSPLQTGIELLPLGVGVLGGAAFNGPIVARAGLRPPVVMGLLLLAAGCAVLGLDQSGYLPVAFSLGLVGVGTGLFLPTLTESVMGGAPDDAGGVAGATADAAVELGAALGVAVLGSVLSTGYDDRLPTTIAQLPPTAHAAVADSLFGANVVAAHLPADQAQALLGAAGEAFTHGLGLAAMVAAGIALVTAVFALRMPRHAGATSGRGQARGQGDARAASTALVSNG
ncbi:MAG: MFS transporter [Actinobacteria bacterium]|nr:MFS transporter [Actinomycetota bacterium]